MYISYIYYKEQVYLCTYNMYGLSTLYGEGTVVGAVEDAELRLAGVGARGA